MSFDDVLEMEKPDPHGQYRLTPCDCGSEEVAYMHCKDLFGNLFWRVRCVDCGAETTDMHQAKHDAQIGWNKRENILKLGAGGTTQPGPV
jgi:ribosomal protein S27E